MSSFAATDTAPAATSFAAQVRARCQLLLSQQATFAEVVDGLAGADPLVIRDVLDTLAGDVVVGSQAQALAHEARARQAERRPPALPIVHPLDYHWRFDKATIKRLVAAAASASEPGDVVVLLGTPSVYLAALEQSLDRRLVLFDWDARIVAVCAAGSRGRAEVLDLERDQMPALDAACVVADPPWYPEAITSFANAAAVAMAPAGTLLISFPARLTRPGVEVELEETVEVARADGLELVSHQPLACRYETPPFEEAAMAAGGLNAAPDSWRRGDLLAFTRNCQPAARRPLPGAPEWTVVELDEIPLRVRPGAPRVGRGLLGHLVDGDVLATVSRRAKVRERVALWTSRNRIFSSSDPERLERVLVELGRLTAAGADGVADLSALVSSIAPADRALAQQVADLVGLERGEYGLGLVHSAACGRATAR
jgi:hypothetical protein